MNMRVEPVSGIEKLCLLTTSISVPPVIPHVFAGGDHARISDGMVYILDVKPNGCVRESSEELGGYWVVRTDNDVEFFCRPDELTPWTPSPGEIVIDPQDDETGVIVEAHDGRSLVKWPRHSEPQIWANADLQPKWD
jgi:hypothetical protein